MSEQVAEQASVEHMMTMIADVIEQRGLAVGQYIDDDTGCCCVFGAWYIVMHPENANPTCSDATEWRINWKRGPVDDGLLLLALRAGHDSVVKWNDSTEVDIILWDLRKGIPDEHRV